MMISAIRVEGPQPFGATRDGQPVQAWTLRNAAGASVRVVSLGATIAEIRVPDRAGRLDNVTLGFDDAAGYQGAANAYFGCTVGRVAGRIARGRFVLDGRAYALAVNNPPNHLHGGPRHALDKALWQGHAIDAGVRFRYRSPDGEEGYPGNVAFEVAYTWSDELVLRIDYRAETDQPTLVNLTNHAYFNLAGAGSADVLAHELMLAADGYLPLDEAFIPSGRIAPVQGSGFDFTQPTALGARIAPLLRAATRGYDHCFALRSGEGIKARLRDPASGRVLELRTDLPGLGLYTGNHLHGQTGAEGKTYALHGAVCLEAQYFPDAIHQDFGAAGAVVLRPGEVYRHHCSYAFSVDGDYPDMGRP